MINIHLCLHACVFFVGLDEEVSDRNLAIVARDHLTDWESLRPLLGQSRFKERKISTSCRGDYGKQKQECLEVWKGKEATYHAPIKAADDANDQSLADSVGVLSMSQQNTPSLHSEGACTCTCGCTYERIYKINTQTLVKDKTKIYKLIPKEQPFKEKLLPRVGLEPTTFSILG